MTTPPALLALMTEPMVISDRDASPTVGPTGTETYTYTARDAILVHAEPSVPSRDIEDREIKQETSGAELDVYCPHDTVLAPTAQIALRGEDWKIVGHPRPFIDPVSQTAHHTFLLLERTTG